MKRFGILTFVSLLVLGVFFITHFLRSDTAAQEVNSQAAVDSIVENILSRRSEDYQTGEVDFGDEKQINILLIGLDSRKEGEVEEAHCDAIHMLTLDIENWNIKITSVPRGTYSWIPYGPYAATDYYLANACAFAGLDYGVSQIENIVGVKADYVATVGFSQTMGILRLFDLPATESLQWLRHRQSYQIGDPQRSHNQAVFIKDMIVNHLDKFRSFFGTPMQYLIYTLMDTDMDFATAKTLLDGYMEAEIDTRPDDIVLQMKPWYATQDLHFDPENAQEQIQALIDFVAPYLSEADLSRMTTADMQVIVVDYIEQALALDESLEDVVYHELWLQIEDDNVREDLQYKILEKYVLELSDGDAIDMISDYILEKETLGLDDWAQKGKDLLASVLG